MNPCVLVSLQTYAHWMETSLTKELDRLVIDPFGYITLATTGVDDCARYHPKIR